MQQFITQHSIKNIQIKGQPHIKNDKQVSPSLENGRIIYGVLNMFLFTGKESRENIEKQMQVMSDQKITMPTEQK